MKKRTFITLFIAFHFIFIILQIHKQSMFVKASYEKQRLEIEYKELITQKQELEQHQAALQNPDMVKKFAENQLTMKAIDYKQIKILVS